ncbi:MAG TPA: glycine cleavage T C-terminal barrel domain-containing protein [Acidimicrobiales bacterium]|nr:glycine cleavage T C-terminal barrel domain-containing protein [Acidimicrobiales bacterium]
MSPTGTIDQVAALRQGAGAFLLPRDVLDVRGDDAETYLQGQLSQDVAALAVGASTDSLLLQPDGKLTALVRVTRVDANGFVLDVDGGYGDLVTARLKKFLLRTKVTIERLEWRCLALRGDAAASRAAGLLAVLSEGGVMALPFEWNGWTGIDLLGPRDLILDPDQGDLPEGVVACAVEAVEACRIVSGLPAMGSELTDRTIAAEAGLVERTVSFTKGCYTGQELVARLDSRGNNVPRRLVGVIGGADASTGALAAGMTLHAVDPPPEGDDPVADKVVGTITSAAWSSEIGAWVALAYLHRTIDCPGGIRIRSGDGLGGAQSARVGTIPLSPTPAPG